jgi:hypothetical protein
MYKRLLYLTLFVLLVIVGNAQVSISVQEPPAGIVQKNQLWNLALIYSGSSPLNVVIGLTLVDMADNQPALTVFSRPLTLTRGVKQLKAADVEPANYEYASPAFSRLADALLPVGNYQACYNVYITGGKTDKEVIAENCIALEIQPLMPPQLALPADSASVQQPYPQFAWLPPAPVTLFNDLNYDLLVTEVRADQSPGTAIQENIPIYNARRLTTPVNSYPASDKSLDTGKVYAWRVIAKNGETFAAQSEVWTFKIIQEKPDVLTPVNGVYLELKKEGQVANTAVIPDNILGIRYYSYDQSREGVIRFMNDKGEVIKEVKRTIKYGNNFLAFKLDRSFEKDSIYTIEITDLGMSRYHTTFRMSN